MLSKFKSFYIITGCILFALISPIFNFKGNSEETLKFKLNNELKKGYLFVGLKQYLGGGKDNFSENKTITFEVNKNFLTLKSLNGIINKSNKINIIWKEVPLEQPTVSERLVFGPYASYESAQLQASKLNEIGFQTTVAYPNNWEVWVPFDNKFPNNKFNYKLSKKIIDKQIIPYLKSENSLLKLEGPIYISANESIKINDINFGKKFYLVKDLYGTWTLIQKIKFDNYLMGVLPHEIGPDSPIEALKAQAVIARTWAIFNSGRFSMDKYHLCISTQCQVYKPPFFQNKKVQKAIKGTSDLIITYKNKPINSFYHGSNGGLSANSSESWKIENYSYFKPTIDGSKSLINSFKLPFKNVAELNYFLNFEKEQFYGDDHYLFRWQKKISNSIIEENLVRNKLIDMNTKVLGIKVLERGLSGRVIKLEIKLKNVEKSIFLVKDDIRRTLNFLPSNLFIINKLNDNLLIFKGGGFGHGVGLSQAGAIEMAKLGFSYEQILNHYYQGTKLKKIEIFSK